MNILYIASSARSSILEGEKHSSISNALGQAFLRSAQETTDEIVVSERNLSRCPPSFISQEWIAAAFTRPEQRGEREKALLSESETLISEVRNAEMIVITTPMYNYGMPACLKAWFDQVVRIGETFTFDLERGDFPLEPIMGGKTLVLLTSSGEFGFDQAGIRAHMNHLGPHIKVLSRYLGVEHFYELGSEFQEFADHRHKQSKAAAIEDAKRLARQLFTKA